MQHVVVERQPALLGSYWNGYQQITRISNESECDDGYRRIRVNSAYVYYHMSCQAQDTDSGQIFTSFIGSPRQQTYLERNALRRCESGRGRGNCVVDECVLIY